MIPIPRFQGRQRLHRFFKRADTPVVRAGRKKMKKKKLFPQFVVARLETKFPHGEHSPHFLTSHNYIHQHSLLYEFKILENEMTIWLRAPETTSWSLLKKWPWSNRKRNMEKVRASKEALLRERKRRKTSSAWQDLNPRPQEFCSAGECSTTVLLLLPSIKLVRVMSLSGSAESCFSNWRHSLNSLTLVASGVLAS